MSVGTPLTKAQIDESLTSIALQIRNAMAQARNLNTQINGGGNGAPVGAAALTAAGYTAADATTALQDVGWLFNLAGVYFGTATVAANFNFDNALAQLWGGQ